MDLEAHKPADNPSPRPAGPAALQIQLARTIPNSYLQTVAPPRYLWRKLTAQQQEELLEWRQKNRRPWHSPPHRSHPGQSQFHLSAACYNHESYIGASADRLDQFSHNLLEFLREHTQTISAWCVLPNHYHALIQAEDILTLLRGLGQFHGRTSYDWNLQDGTLGRKVFHGATERSIRSERHFYATLNYIHHNAVHHRYAERWTDWRWSSATEYLELVGRTEARRTWEQYPVLDYGSKWDSPDL